MPRISTDNYDTVASWNGSQDLFVVEQPDGTKVATPAMVKQYVLGNSIDDIYSVMGQNGAKNLIPYPYPKMSTTIRGITWSDNGDGGIVGNGTGTEASSQPYCELNGSLTNNAKDLLLKANTWYTLTCKRTSPYAIGANIYFLDPTTMQQTSITFDVIYGDSAQTTATKNNVFMYNAGVVSEEVKFKLPQDMYAQVQVRYKAGTNVTVSNDVQYPMLRLASDTDNTYHPYAKTNKKLTNDIDDVYKTMGEMGAKNLYNSQYSVPRTNAGTTATLGDDGHVIMNGTANADAAQFDRPGTSIKPIKDLKVGDKLILSYKVISGTFTHGSSNRNTTLYFNNKNGSAVDPIIFPLSLSAGDSDSKEITLTDVCFTDGILDLKDIQIYMRSGDTFNNLELAIMLRLASDTDNTYQPYAKTNRQLTDELSGKQDTLSFDDVPTQNSNNPVKSGGIKSSIDDKAKRLNNIKIIDEDFVILFVGYSDTANRVLCPINFPFAFSGTDYTLTCSRIELVSVGNFTTGISVDTKYRSAALIILSRASAVGTVFVGRAHIHISRTE